MSSDLDNGFWKWVVGGLLTMGGSVFGYHKFIVSRLDGKADKEDVAEIRSELATQRGHIAKLYDQARENEQRAQDRHERLMERLTQNGH